MRGCACGVAARFFAGRRWIVAFGLATGAAACDGDGCKNGVGPECPPSSITVTSPIGDRLAVGRTVQLSAEARDSRGGILPNVPFTWSSSASAIAQAGTSGIVSGVAAGTATISAHAHGVTGSVGLRVIDADLDGIAGDLSDPFTLALVGNLTATVRGRVQTALAQCTAGVTQGNFSSTETCLSGVRAELTGATDATDRALLATLALFVDHIERLLNVSITALGHEVSYDRFSDRG